MSELALFGGPKTITQPFTPYRPIGQEELDAVQGVIRSGTLSKFLGCWDPDFYGGEQVQAFERAWEQAFRVKHAISMNSNTSGLMAAVGAIGVEPGDEVIVSPWTMSASATSILIWNAIPVFADIEDRTFNLDPTSIKKNITPWTRAILVSDIFGHAADLEAIMAIAREHNLRVIEDAAQAPGALYKGRHVGTVADIGVFSLNYHKHIHTGEGGVCVTDDPVLAERLQLIRNHAEAVAGDKGVANLANLIGFNFRLTEIAAAIGSEQLKKLPALLALKDNIRQLSDGLARLPGLRPPIVEPECTHVYYVYGLVYDPDATGISRDVIVRALQAEGVPASGQYENLHLLPIYQQRIAYGSKGFPWSGGLYKGSVSYRKGVCPVAEDLQDRRYIGLEMCSAAYTDQEIGLLAQAFHKVWAHLDTLRAQQSVGASAR
jgi:perosamine synthetase